MMRADERPLTAAKDIRARAAEWLVEARSSDHWDTEAQAKLQAWLAESQSHAVEFLRLEAAWNRTDRLVALRLPRRRLFDGTARFGSALIRAVAGLALLAVAGAGVELLPRNRQVQTYATAVGGRETLKLADGSTVELNTDSVLRIGLSGGERRVWLDRGEAFFQVVHNSAHPFVVVAGDHRITDLGTKFDVRCRPDMTEVSLVEGSARVDVTAGDSVPLAVLEPGDVALATAHSLTVKRQKPEILQAALGWRHGMLVFHHATLADAVAEFNRYNREKLAVGDSYAASRTFNGILPTNDAAAFVRVTQKTFGLHAERRGNETVISR